MRSPLPRQVHIRALSPAVCIPPVLYWDSRNRVMLLTSVQPTCHVLGFGSGRVGLVDWNQSRQGRQDDMLPPDITIDSVAYHGSPSWMVALRRMMSMLRSLRLASLVLLPE